MEDERVKKIIKSIYRNYELAVEYNITDCLDKTKYKSMVESLLQTEWESNRAHTAIAQAVHEGTDETFESIYTEALQSDGSQNDPKSTKRYKDLARSLDECDLRDRTPGTSADPLSTSQRINVDDDVQMTQHIPEIDPITKQRLENPVRNRLCGHIYGHESILDSLAINSKLRCPYYGCNNKTAITADDLILDADLAEKLKNRRRR